MSIKTKKGMAMENIFRGKASPGSWNICAEITFEVKKRATARRMLAMIAICRDEEMTPSTFAASSLPL